MENSHETSNGHMEPLPWLDLRVIYLRISKCEIDESTPRFLKLTQFPLDPETLIEINGARTDLDSSMISILLKRSPAEKNSKEEEAVFVNTDCIRIKGSVKFQVFDMNSVLLSGILEPCYGNGTRWRMNCELDMISGPGSSFLKGKKLSGCSELDCPTIEVYIAGAFSGNPIILTKSLKLSFQGKNMRSEMLDSIPDQKGTEVSTHVLPTSRLALQATEYHYQRLENKECDNNNLYSRTEYMIEDEDGELSWFNVGVRMGVGIAISICLGVGIGVGLLIRSYKDTTRNIRRRLL